MGILFTFKDKLILLNVCVGKVEPNQPSAL